MKQAARDAGLLPRGVAYLVDSVAAFAIFALSQTILFKPAREALGITEAFFHTGLNTEVYVLLTVSLPIWFYFSLSDASRRQGTIGKRVMGLRVVDARASDAGRIGRRRSFGRTVVKLLPWELAHLANHFPEPIWYAQDPGFRPAFLVSGILMTIYVVCVARGKRHQAPHDRLAGTVVRRALPRPGA